MHRLMLGACGAVMLTGCGQSICSTPPLPRLPPPPAAATAPCLPTPQRRQADGSATAADDDGTIRDGRADLAACDDKRRLTVEAWPKQKEQ